MFVVPPRRPQSVREALLEQLAYLASEADALQSVIQRIPDTILGAQPLPGQLSVKELYALLLRTDECVHLPFVETYLGGARRRPPKVLQQNVLGEEVWNETPVTSILTRLARARRRLVETCERASNDEWIPVATADVPEIDLCSYLYGVVQNDVEILRRLGERLHEARLSDRVVSTPR